MGRLTIAVIADSGRVPRFGLDALDAVRDCDEVTVFSCIDTRAEKRRFRHAASAALTARNPWTKAVPVRQGRKRVADTVEFAAGQDGAWQTLPPDVVRRLSDGGFDVVLALGMGALRVPSPDLLPVPVLAFSLGDPDRRSGRPVGFRETANGDPVLTQTIEVLGQKPGGGRVVAVADTKVFPHSYRATLTEAYRHTPLLIDRAIENALSGAASPGPRGEVDDRLPSNGAVAGFALARAWHLLRRLAYGAVVEKRWEVSTAPAPADPVRALAEGELPPTPGQWRTIRPGRGYVFYADPFMSDDPPGVLVEALKSSTGRGELLLVQDDTHSRISPPGGHFSYPATIRVDGQQVIVPETASWASPSAYVLRDGELEELHPLDVEGDARILDPTLLDHQGQTYLFGNLFSMGSNALCLWVADSISSPFRLHPMSPVLVSPRGARMAGGFLRSGGQLLRFGQDFCAGYGNGIFAFEVDELSPTTFREHPIGEIRFADRKGPHTLNFGNGQVVFDWYVDRFAPLAGVRRVLGRA
jgi:hypothetical protein